VIQQTGYGRAITLNHGEYTGREARVAPKLCESKGGMRILFAWLKDEAVAARYRIGEHPHWNHGWEVERGDARHHAQGLAN
jgi:hypothetical protein